MENVNSILTLMRSPSAADKALITKALDFAKLHHEGQVRLSGAPYFSHPFETAKNLAHLGMDATTISAGLLHDIIEDAEVSTEEIEKEFGKEILFLIEGVTKLGKLKYRGLERHTESLQKLFVAMSQDLRVLIIKLADRLHNMRTLEFVREEKRGRIAMETLEIYAPLADRLGMSKLKGDLEDLAFPYVYPEQYEKVKKMAEEKTQETSVLLEKMERQLREEFNKEKVVGAKVSRRFKHYYSLFRKLERKDWDIEKIYDISALRIVVSSVSDCYRVLGIVHSFWRPLPGRIKDYIAFPKPSGYKSVHTTVFAGDGSIIEIQIRTEEMHRDAELGVASHFSYKEASRGTKSRQLSKNFLWIAKLLPNFAQPKSISSVGDALPSGDEMPLWVKQLAEIHTGIFDPKEFLNNLKTDFFEHRVFAFTPQGDVIDLPFDSSPIDFAYSIHSDIGDHIAGVKVNGKLVSLDTPIKNGDIVEVMTKKSSHPSSKWLEMAKTTLAKRHIRNALENKNL
jgi:guanosine-3',5'-bis(diphosphate) 3'-pyrophosphohydrolase